MLEVQFLPILQCAFNCFLHRGSIFRMETFEEQLQRRLDSSLILKNPKGLIRPIEISGRNIPVKAPRTAERLRLRKAGLPSPEFLGQFPLFCDVQRTANEPRESAVLDHRLADTMHRSNPALRMDNAVSDIAANTFGNHLLQGLLHD